ncbi:MAG: hypothetical protein PHT49_00285 [Desulfovibrionales bacterium]|nr:hypothetical protein [Desulfovibrionales bacterium]
MKFSRIAKSLIVHFNLVQLSVRLGMPILTARLAMLLSKSFNTGSKYNVLCLGRSIFDEDIEELAKYGSTLNYLIIPKFVFISIFNHYFSQMPLSQSHIKYHEFKGFNHEKEMYRRFLKALLSELSKSSGINAVMSANYVYAWQQELAVVCNEAKIPFVVLFKEGISPVYKGGDASQDAHDLLVNAYTNNKFIGTKLLVYNEKTRNAFVNANIEGISRDTVEIVGIPRFDRYFKLKTQGNNIVFFSFSIEDKARHLELSEEVLNEYIDKSEKFHIEVMRYAKSNSGQNVVIKTKRNIRYLNYVKKIAKNNGYSNLKNLLITNTGNVYDHIKNSFAIIGYNSTALLEGFAACRLIITPDFRGGIIHDFFEEYPNLANYAKNMEDIERIVSKGSAIAINNEELKSLLCDRIYIPDGQACRRTEASIRKAIDMFKNKEALEA